MSVCITPAGVTSVSMHDSCRSQVSQCMCSERVTSCDNDVILLEQGRGT